MYLCGKDINTMNYVNYQDTRTKKCVVMYLCNNKVKIYFTYRKYMYSPPFKDYIAVASYSMKPSNISRKCILVHA